MLLFGMILATQGLLQVNQIHDDSGYIKIKIKQVEIVNETNTIVHIINTREIINTIDKLENYVDKVEINNKEIVKIEMKNLKAKLKTISTQQDKRVKRGLINMVGTTYKWLFGTMDDNDRQDILEHLKLTDENNHNAINNINKQVYINSHFNKTLYILKNAIDSDYKQIYNSFNITRQANNEMKKHLLYMDIMLKLKMLETKITDIQNNIAAARHNMVHPGILTAVEVEMFEIDFYKLKLMKLGVMNYKNDQLIFAFKIPKNYISTELKLITPLPNSYFFEIDTQNDYIVEINNQVYTYNSEFTYNQLTISTHCILQDNCKFRFNNKTSIDLIDDDTIILKNAHKIVLEQNCDDRKITLTNNSLIQFYNCEIQLNNQHFYNKKTVIEVKYFYSNNNNFNIPIVKELTLANSDINNINNIKEIEELKMHKTISYGLNGVIIFVIILTSVIFIILFLRKKNIQVNIKPAIQMERIQENSNSGGGGVTYTANPQPHVRIF